MTPAYKLSIGGEEIRERLTLLAVLDRAGFSGDTLTLQLRADGLAIPRRGTEISCELGYEESGTGSVGEFVVEDVIMKGSPRRGHMLTVVCISQPQGEVSLASLQTTKNERVWQEFDIAGTTFGDVVSDVCSAVGLIAHVDSRLSALEMPHTRQSNESDAAFLHRLTVERNGIVKMNGGIVVFETRDRGRLGDMEIVYNERVMTYSFDFTERYNIESVRAKYTDFETGEIGHTTVGSGKGIKVIPKVFADQNTATLAADALLKHYQRDYITGMVKIPMPSPIGGQGALLAEKLINLSGFPGGDDVNRQYVCTQAKHIYTKQDGLVSDLTLKRPQE